MYCQLDRSQRPPFPLKPTETYLGEDDSGYYVMEGFLDNLGNMFKRMVKFTPKSFTPGNIFKAVRNTTLTTMTGGVYLALPKNVKKTMEQVANVALPVAAAGIAAVTLGPSIMAVVGPKLSTVATVLGKNISTVGKGLFDVLGKLSPSQQSSVAQRVTSDDLLYAEQHQGQLPPQVMQYVDEAAKMDYGYALNAAQLAQANAKQYYGEASLYPGLQQAMLEPPKDTEPAGSWSSGEVAAAVGAGVLVAFLIGKK
jgi:hypothetical protein